MLHFSEPVEERLMLPKYKHLKQKKMMMMEEEEMFWER
jgi:hypothetical protein